MCVVMSVVVNGRAMWTVYQSNRI
ncbi:hypothetical protein PENFLA_c169G10030, partial [Penicillium flavigenum]